MSETEDNLRAWIGSCKKCRGGFVQENASSCASCFNDEAAPNKLRQYAEAVYRWLQSARLYPRINHEPLLPDFRAFDVGEAEASRIIFEARRECARMSEEPYAI